MISNPHFFIFGYFGWFNIGDDAIGLSIITKLKKSYPDATFTITCNNNYILQNLPEEADLGAIRIIGFYPLSISKELIKSDYFIIAGGTHIHDDDQLKLRRFKLLLSFVILTSLAKLVRKSPTLIGHGVGPLNFCWSRLMAKIIFYNSNKIFVRDEDSYDLVSSLGFRKKSILGFDCAAALFVERSSEVCLLNNSVRKNIVGISLLPAFEIYYGDDKKDNEIVRSFALSLNIVIQRHRLTELRLFAFRTGDKHSDTAILSKLISNLDIDPSNIKLVQYSGNICSFIESIDECNIFIGMRYHASLFAYLLNKPQLIINYMGKCDSLGRDIAINGNAIIPYENILKPEFLNEVQSFLSNPTQYMAGLPITIATSRMQIMFETLGENL